MKKAAAHVSNPRSLRSKALKEAQLKKEQGVGIKREGPRVSDEELKVESKPAEEVVEQPKAEEVVEEDSQQEDE